MGQLSPATAIPSSKVSACLPVTACLMSEGLRGHVSSYITEKDGGIPSNCTLKKVMMEMRFPLLRDGGGKVHDLQQ